MKTPIIKAGQGRTQESVEGDAMAAIVLVLSSILFVLYLILAG